MSNEKRNKLKICYIYQDQYPWDIRVEKFCNTFLENGIEVHIISRNRDGLSMLEQVSENFYIHRLSDHRNKYLRNFLNFPAFFSPFWIFKIINIIKENSIDLVIIRDLPLSPAAILAAKLKRKIVFMDMAENYPAMIMDTWKYRGFNLIDFCIRNPWLLKQLEKIVLPRFDGILVVTKHSQRRIEKLRVKRNKIWVISNTPRVDCRNVIKNDSLFNKLRKLSGFILLYVGGLEETRGLEIVVKALPTIKKKIPNVLFVIVGQGTSATKLKTLAIKLGVSGHLILTGWVDSIYIPSIIQVADVCIVPHFVTEHTNTTIPNKIFDYMAQKKPVLVTQSKSLSEIVESENCGLVYTDSSPESLADSIFKLLDKKYRTELGHNGWVAINKKYNWSHDKMNLIKIIRSIALKN